MDYVLHAADKDMVVHLTIYFWLAVPTNAFPKLDQVLQ